jgi:predicted RNA-binding Zn ribbon-like protein
LKYSAYYSNFIVRSQIKLDAYNQRLAQLAEDFINSHDLYLEQPEHLLTPTDLGRFLVAHGIQPQEAVTQSDLDAARVIRDQVRSAWTAGTVEEAVEILNPLLGEIPVQLQAQSDDQDSVQLHYEAQPDSSVVAQLGMQSALGIVALLQHEGLDRLRACAASPCRDVFVDTSRNKSRRFCSDRCANRYNIAAFRERKDKDGG